MTVLNGFCLLLIATTLLAQVEWSKGLLTKRSNQAQEFMKENVLKTGLENFTNKKVKYSKRFKIETMCLQAGLKISYVEYLLLSIISALVIGVFTWKVSNNVGMGFMFVIIGYIAPKQAICFMKNMRVTKIKKQVGLFMKMFLERYNAVKDGRKALKATKDDFKGVYPIYSELEQAVLDVELGGTIQEGLDGLGRRTGNKYMAQLADYYGMTETIGTEEIQKNLLAQAYIQFEEDRENTRFMKKEIAGPVKESYVMVFAIPMFALYQIMSNPDYVPFMRNTSVGQIGTTFIVGVFVGAIWFINAKIGAPIE